MYILKKNVLTSGKPMRHRNVHCLLICNKDNWNELEYVKNRRGDDDSKLVDMYKSQDRPLDTDSYSQIPARF